MKDTIILVAIISFILWGAWLYFMQPVTKKRKNNDLYPIPKYKNDEKPKRDEVRQYPSDTRYAHGPSTLWDGYESSLSKLEEWSVVEPITEKESTTANLLEMLPDEPEIPYERPEPIKGDIVKK